MPDKNKLTEEQVEQVTGGAFPPPFTVKSSNDNAIYGSVNAGGDIIIADNIVSDGGAISNSVNTGILGDGAVNTVILCDNSTVVKPSQSIR